MRITVDMQALVGGERRAFGIIDPRIERQRRGFAGFGDFDRTVGGDVPRVRKIQVRRRARHQCGIRKPRAGILGRESGDAASLGHRRPDRVQREIRGAGRTLALPEIDRNPHAAIALVFQGLDLPETHADRQTRILADGRFGLRGPSGPSFFQGTFDDGL